MITIQYNPKAHTELDLQESGYSLHAIGKKMVLDAVEADKTIEVDNPYLAEACEIMAKYFKHEVKFLDKNGAEKSMSDFYRIFASPMRELDILRADVDMYLAGSEDPFSDEEE